MRVMYKSSYDDTFVVEQINSFSYDTDFKRVYLESMFEDQSDKYIEGIEYDAYVKLAGELLLNGYLDLTEYTVESGY